MDCAAALSISSSEDSTIPDITDQLQKKNKLYCADDSEEDRPPNLKINNSRKKLGTKSYSNPKFKKDKRYQIVEEKKVVTTTEIRRTYVDRKNDGKPIKTKTKSASKNINERRKNLS